NGLTPVVPTVAPLTDDNGQPLPYLASNDITSFTIFNTGSATLTSYYFDTREPDSAVVKFDEFKLGQP
ncbi:MAG: metallophosphoesterase, partial [Cyanobacteria bacterium J06553_1]